MSPASLFVTGLQLLFIGLRLSESITWSWWLVMLPLLIALALYLALIFFIGFAVYLQEKSKYRMEKALREITKGQP